VNLTLPSLRSSERLEFMSSSFDHARFISGRKQYPNQPSVKVISGTKKAPRLG
jgi:hypothetical protein